MSERKIITAKNLNLIFTSSNGPGTGLTTLTTKLTDHFSAQIGLDTRRSASGGTIRRALALALFDRILAKYPHYSSQAKHLFTLLTEEEKTIIWQEFDIEFQQAYQELLKGYSSAIDSIIGGYVFQKCPEHVLHLLNNIQNSETTESDAARAYTWEMLPELYALKAIEELASYNPSLPTVLLIEGKISVLLKTLATFFVRDISALTSFGVMLTVDPGVAANRVIARNPSMSYEATLASNEIRRNRDFHKYMATYGALLEHPIKEAVNAADQVLDTTDMTPYEVLVTTLGFIELYLPQLAPFTKLED